MGVMKETMRKMCYIFVALLTLLFALTLVACGDTEQEKPAAVSKYVEGMDDFEYYADDETVTLFWPKDKTKKSVTIPACVTEINGNAFDGCVLLEEVKFEKGCKLKRINTFAFKDCTALKKIWLPPTVELLGDRVFYGCTSLEEADFSGEGITSCGSLIFEKCASLKRVVVPAGMTNVGEKEFADCVSLESVKFCEGVTAIADNAFYGKKLVGEMTFPSSIKKIGDRAFYGNEFSAISFSENVESIGKEAFYSKDSSYLKDLTLPFVGQTANGGTLSDVFSQSSISSLESLTILGGMLGGDSLKWFSGLTLEVSDDVNIKAGALDNTEWYKNQKDGVVYVGNIVYGYKGTMSQPTAIVIKEGATKIIDGAFGIQENAVSFEISSTVKEIGKKVLTAPYLLRIKVSADNKNYASDGNCLLKKDENGNIGKTVLMGCNGSEIPSYVTVIGEYAFELMSVDALKIPKYIQRIETGAFIGAVFSENIVFESGSQLQAIGDYAFCTYAYYMRNVVLDLGALNNLKSIGEYAFDLGNNSVDGLNNGITSVILPKNLTSIGKYAFGPNLESIQVATGNDTFTVTDNCLIKDSTVVLGTSDSVIPTKVNGKKITTIGDYAFAYKTVSNLVIPDGIETIGNGAFEKCQGITTLNLPKSVKNLGANAFSGTDIARVTIPTTVVSIGEKAFAELENLECVEFEIESDNGGYGLQSIAQNAFERSSAPKTLTAPMGILSKIKDCFSFVETINVIGNDDIPAQAFSDWIPQKTKAINIDEGVRKIGDMAFADCEITSFVLPASVTEIGVGILTYCPIESLSVASGNARYYAKNNYIIDSYSHSIVIACKNSGEIPTSFKYVTVNNKNVKEYDVTSIANGAFKGVEIERITIPSNIKSIGDYAFAQSTLRTVNILSGVESIGRSAFEGATNLTSVSVADSVKSIGYAAFRGTEFYAQKQATETGISYIGKVAYAYHGDKTGVAELEVADGTVGIAEHAFERMSNLKKIILPSSLKNIDKEVFVGCKNLTNLYFNGTDDSWKAVTKVRNWDLNLPVHKTWTLCRCDEKSHDHDGDGIVKKPDEAADVCQNYKLFSAEVCDECFDKEVDKAVGRSN